MIRATRLLLGMSLATLLVGCAQTQASGPAPPATTAPGSATTPSPTPSPSPSPSPTSDAGQAAAIAHVQAYEELLLEMQKDPLNADYQKLINMGIGTGAAPGAASVSDFAKTGRRFEGEIVYWDWSATEMGINKYGNREVLVEYCTDNRELLMIDVPRGVQVEIPHLVLLNMTLVELTPGGSWAINDIANEEMSPCSVG